jgi:YbbR domain-containing protein
MRIQNLSLKAASLLIALLLAYGVHRAGNASVVSLLVPIEIKNAPEEKVLVKPTKRAVQVTLKGPSFLIGPVASSPPPLQAKLPDNADDKVAVTFTADDLSLPRSVEVVSIEPAQMEFTFEPIERRDVKIEVPRLGQLPTGLVLEGIEVTPKNVTVKGARSEVRQLKVLETEPVNLSEISGPTDLSLGLRSSNSSLTLSAKSVMARVTVGQVPSQRQFSERPLEVRMAQGAGKFVVNPSVVTVTVSGPPDAIVKLNGGDVIPFIRVAELPEEESVKIKVQVDLPSAIKVVAVDPSSVSIEQSKPLAVRKAIKKPSR